MNRKNFIIASCFLIASLFAGAFATLIANNSVSIVGNAFKLSASAHTHSGNHYIGKAATCTEDGIREYWISCDTHEVFFDPNSEEVLNGSWVDTGLTGDHGIGGGE